MKSKIDPSSMMKSETSKKVEDSFEPLVLDSLPDAPSQFSSDGFRSSSTTTRKGVSK